MGVHEAGLDLSDEPSELDNCHEVGRVGGSAAHIHEVDVSAGRLYVFNPGRVIGRTRVEGFEPRGWHHDVVFDTSCVAHDVDEMT
jgi:hypothetical protein